MQIHIPRTQLAEEATVKKWPLNPDRVQAQTKEDRVSLADKQQTCLKIRSWLMEKRRKSCEFGCWGGGGVGQPSQVIQPR